MVRKHNTVRTGSSSFQTPSLVETVFLIITMMVREPRFSDKSFFAVAQKVRRPLLAIFLARKILLRLSHLDESQAVGSLFALQKYKNTSIWSVFIFLCANQDSNLGPLEYQSSALPAELFAHIRFLSVKIASKRARFDVNNLPSKPNNLYSQVKIILSQK